MRAQVMMTGECPQCGRSQTDIDVAYNPSQLLGLMRMRWYSDCCDREFAPHLLVVDLSGR